MKSKAVAVWNGGLKTGTGRISLNSGALKEARYSFVTRFEEGRGTNPEELIGAAHAACFSMALSAQLEEFKLVAGQIQTDATVTLEKTSAGWSVTSVHLEVQAAVPGARDADFQAAVAKTKEGCPISRLLKTQITVNATLL